MAKYAIAKRDGKWYLGREPYGFRTDSELWECESLPHAVAVMSHVESVKGSDQCESQEIASNWDRQGPRIGWGWT